MATYRVLNPKGKVVATEDIKISPADGVGAVLRYAPTLHWVAVAEGFEPPDGFSRLSLSRRVH
jgi:hypothetical protein